MKLFKLKLHNFRSFGDGEKDILFDDLTAFIGNNSAGKTTAMCALNCIFSENPNDRVVKRSDFHLPKEKSPDEMLKQDMYIEAIFTFEELKNEQGQKYAIPEFFESLVVDVPNGVPYLRIRLIATWESSNTTEGAIDSKIVYVTCPEEQEITEASTVIAHRKELDRIRVIYIPAVRQPEKQLKNVSGTMMHQIMSSINWGNVTKENINTKIKELNEKFMEERGVSILGESIKKQWKEYDTDSRYSDAELRFNSTDLDTALKKAEVVFLPTVTGKEYNVEEMGDGLRSLFYISMVDSILDVENTIRKEIEKDVENLSFNKIPPTLTVIIVEEPENHIAPHLLGKLILNLKNIALKSNGQVVLSSHSPSIIKRIEPENIRYFKMVLDIDSTDVRMITLPDKERYEDQYKYIKEAVKAYPELYFSRLVILGEGDSEEIILPKFLECCGSNIDVSGISVAPLGGRHVNHFWRLLNDLQIPYITVLDLDRERRGGGWERIEYVLKQLIKIGYQEEDVLKITSDKTIPKSELDKIDSWSGINNIGMEDWINLLESKNVFFSSPLDIDFLMLESYGIKYKNMLGEKEGPRIELSIDGKKEQKKIIDIEKLSQKPNEYTERIEDDIRNTLKKEGGNGNTYTDEQKALMIWYNYFFLNRGKPSTHILAFSRINEGELKERMPSVIRKIINRTKQLLL